MALLTLGTTAQTSLDALEYRLGAVGADVVGLSALIKDDRTGEGTVGAFQAGGKLYVPRRGWLTIQPGDFVAIDATGWPILISAAAAAGADFVHT